MMVFSESDLRIAVKHLAFDMFYFRHYAETHTRLHNQPEHRACFQAMIYSMLLHFRVLLHFFYGTALADDCCAEHFRVLPGFEGAFPSAIHAKPIWEEEMRKHLNKRLAHFTATRWTENRPPLDYYTRRFPEVLELVGRFESALPAEIGSHFSSQLKFWEAQC